MMAQFVRGKPIMTDYIPAAAYSAGDVIVLGNTPMVAHEDNPMFGGTTPVITDALAAEGGIYKMTADGAIAVGVLVYWDATAQKVSLTASGNTVFGYLVQGPTLVASDPGTAASGDACLVLHAPRQAQGSTTYTISSITAAGAAQGNAANLNYGFNLVAGADGTTGVILPAAIKGRSLIVKNNASAAAPGLKVYPQVGGTVNALAANSNYAMGNFTATEFIANSNSTWHTVPVVAS